MIFIAGDIHGPIDIYKVINYFADETVTGELSKKDYLILLGDTSICWDGGRIDSSVRAVLQGLPVTTLFIDGNHDNHRIIAEYPVSEWNGGHIHEIESDIFHLMRGEVFIIEGKKFFAFGGAYSVDKDRRVEDISWWPEEMPSKEEYENGLKNLQKNNWTVDIILSHTAPSMIVYNMGMEFIDGEEELQNYLQQVADNAEFTDWYFGHFHEDLTVEEKYHGLMEEIICLK